VLWRGSSCDRVRAVDSSGSTTTSSMRTGHTDGVDYWQDLATLQTPLLFVRAHNSAYVSDLVAQRMVNAASNARLVNLSHTGHRISADNPTALGRAMIDFLGNLNTDD